MSTSQGPCRLETRNCTIANDRPAVRQAGHTSRVRRKPAMAATSQNGTSTEKNGSWRPTIADRSWSGSPVTLARVMSGVPMAPKATGAVLPISDRPAACSGRNPSPMSMAAQMAIGVPNPAAPSMNAPKLNAISSSWMRRSTASPAMVRRTSSNLPVLTVMS